MPQDPDRLHEHAQASLRRLLPRIESRFAESVPPADWEGYVGRLKRHFPRLFANLFELYGDQYDFFYHLEGVLVSATEMWIAQLRELATELRHRGISLTLDFLFNHTSDEHDWACKALQGDPEYRAYYRTYRNRTLPDPFEASMPEVFTEDHPGAFTWHPRLRAWVWTTFHTYQ